MNLSKTVAAELSAIKLSYQAPLFNQLELQFFAGEHCAIVGANGAGKTSLFKLLSGEIIADSGQVNICNKPLEQWQRNTLSQRFAILPQQSSLNFSFTVSEVVQLGLSNQKHSLAEQQGIIDRLLTQFELSQLSQHFYPQLSGGEKQRVHFARICAQLSSCPIQQQLLCLDEPTSALDIHHQHQLMGYAQSLSVQGAAVISIVHDLNLAARYCSRVILLKQGKVFADGSPEQVFTEANLHSVFNYTATLIDHPEHNYPIIL